MINSAEVTGGKPVAVSLQPISGVYAINPLVTFYYILGREVLFFYFAPDTTRDCKLYKCNIAQCLYHDHERICTYEFMCTFCKKALLYFDRYFRTVFLFIYCNEYHLILCRYIGFYNVSRVMSFDLLPIEGANWLGSLIIPTVVCILNINVRRQNHIVFYQFENLPWP
jgi:hypothetical protein